MPNGNDTNGVSAAQAIASALVALGFLALVAIIFWRATDPNQDFDKIWAATGTIIGVVVGAIPSFFFQRQARSERTRSAVLADRATRLAAMIPPEQAKDAAKIMDPPAL
jgi:divalent metal cation (Fe/Co/Zn/Cd) transporter